MERYISIINKGAQEAQSFHKEDWKYYKPWHLKEQLPLSPSQRRTISTLDN